MNGESFGQILETQKFHGNLNHETKGERRIKFFQKYFFAQRNTERKLLKPTNFLENHFMTLSINFSSYIRLIFIKTKNCSKS